MLFHLFYFRILFVISFSANINSKVFHNIGEIEGWDKTFSEHLGTVENDRETKYNGSSSIKFTQVRILRILQIQQTATFIYYHSDS